VIATAILDRLLHHSHVLNIRSDRHRLREKKRAGCTPFILPAQEALPTPNPR